MATTLAEVLRHFEADYVRTHALSSAQARVWRAIVACRTPALGGQRWRCDGCAVEQWRWHSCRNRHCPQCQHRQRDAWRAARLGELLNVPYCHLVFTLPHELNALAGVHARWVYDTLMQCTAATLSEFAANPRWLGGTGAFTLVLHTWTQDLRRHIHVHALMACGAVRLDADAAGGSSSWVAPKRSRRFLFPVHALSKVFRGKFLTALDAAGAAGKLPRDPAGSAALWQRRAQALRRHDWVVYARTPLAGPAAVLDYLSRYTHRTAIGNERLLGIDGDRVRLRVRADDSGTKRVIAIDGAAFIERFMQHVLPSGFKRIRHYGVLAPAAKTTRLALARSLLAMPTPNAQAREDAQAFMRRVAAIDIERCPHCKLGRWQLVQALPAAALDEARRLWRALPAGQGYLFNHKALAKVFRGKLLDALKACGLQPPVVLPERWVVHCKRLDHGDSAIVYLGRYLYRGVIQERDILRLDDSSVTYRWRDSKTGQLRQRTVGGVEFLRLVLQHVLPKGLRRARSYGFLHPNARRLAALLKLLVFKTVSPQSPPTERATLRCSCCGAPMRIICRRTPPPRGAPSSASLPSSAPLPSSAAPPPTRQGQIGAQA